MIGAFGCGAIVVVIAGADGEDIMVGEVFPVLSVRDEARCCQY
jgi:hypothetical protein